MLDKKDIEKIFDNREEVLKLLTHGEYLFGQFKKSDMINNSFVRTYAEIMKHYEIGYDYIDNSITLRIHFAKPYQNLNYAIDSIKVEIYNMNHPLLSLLDEIFFDWTTKTCGTNLAESMEQYGVEQYGSSHPKGDQNISIGVNNKDTIDKIMLILNDERLKQNKTKQNERNVKLL